MENFKKLKIWQKGMEVVMKTYELAKTLPEDERFGLSMQIKKCSVSIPSNISEGSATSSKNDYRRFLEIALRSSFELETQLLIIEMLEYGNKTLVEQLLSAVDEEQKMIQGFLNAVENASL